MENKREKYERDRISGLPQSLLLHILCFLSQKKAVQTSVLSKSWRHLGPTRPVIDLRRACEHNLLHVRGIDGVCENCLDGNNEAFISVLETTFERYHEHNLFPHKLDLHMFRAGCQSIPLLQKWIPTFINAVTTFRLSFAFGPYSNLPSAVFKAEYLRELHLCWCSLNDIGNVLLKNLEKLSLETVYISHEALEKIISGCPLVKRLVIRSCFQIFCVNRDKDNIGASIPINAPTLESIHIEHVSSNWCPNNVYFPYLKSLFLSDVTVSTYSFHYFSDNFPRLEELSLIYCSGFDEINLSSCSIKRLIVREIRKSSLKKVAIQVPNIRYLEFSYKYFPTTFSLTTTSREWKSHLNFYHYISHNRGDVLQRIIKLFEMVKTLSQSQISLTFHDIDLYFKTKQWDFIDHPVRVENLGLKINKLCPDSLARVLNALFHIFHPKYTNAECARHNDDEEATKFLWKTLIHERKKTEYGWEEHLEEVSIEASDEKGKVWHHVESTSLPEWSKNQKIRFRMKWRD